MSPPFFDTGTSAGVRHAAIALMFVALAVWMKYVVARVPPGLLRVALALPVLLANTLAPFIWSIDEILPRTSALCNFSWLGSSKVLTFCLGREPLREAMTVPQFAAVMMLPIFPKPPSRSKSGPEGRLGDSAGSGAALAARWAAKLVCLGVVVTAITVYGEVLPRVVLHYAYAFGLYFFVGFLMDGPGAVAVEALGLELVPTFDAPWLSRSLADFWGRRWNITTSSLLRTLVYDPIVEGSLLARPLPSPPAADKPKPAAVSSTPAGKAAGKPSTPITASSTRSTHPGPSMLRRQLGLHAVFLTSGLVHEYVAWNVSGSGWHWKWTLFFYIQAPLMSLEGYGRRLLRRAGVPSLPVWLTTLATLALLEVLAYDWFFGFVERDTDIADRVVAALFTSYQAVLAPLRPLLAAAVAAAGGGGAGSS